MRRLARIVLVLVVLLVVLIAALAILVPRWVKERIIAAAAAEGIALTIDDVTILPGRAKLEGVRATPLIAPDDKKVARFVVTAPTVAVTIDGLTPTAITVTGAQADIDGHPGDVRALFALPPAHGAQPSSIQTVTLHDATLVWKHPADGNILSLRAAHAEAVITRKEGRALGDDWHVDVRELHAFDGIAKPPPVAWTLVGDHDAAGTRYQLGMGKAATVKLGLGDATSSLDIDMPSTGIDDLGIPPSLLGIYADETSRFEIHLHHHMTDATHAETQLVATANGVFLGHSPARTNAVLDAKAAGDPASAITITEGTLRAGPFTGKIDGGFSLPPGGLKAALHYESGLMSCLDAVKAQASSLGALGEGAAALAGILGLDHVVEGTVKLEGRLELDTLTGNNHADFRTAGACKLSYLPSP